MFLVDYINPPRVWETRRYDGDDLQLFFKYVLDSIEDIGCKAVRIHHRESGADAWKLLGTYSKADLEELL